VPDRRAILPLPGCNVAEAIKEMERLSMEICCCSVPWGAAAAHPCGRREAQFCCTTEI